MRFVLSSEQLEVGTVAAKVLGQQVPLARLRELADAAEAGELALAIDEEAWRQCAELGWFALGIPASLGGVGCGPIEEVLLFIELGRHLAPGPFASTVMAAWIAAASGHDDLASQLIDGSRRAGLEVDGFLMDAEPSGLVVRVEGAVSSLCEVGAVVPVPSVDASVRLARGGVGEIVARVEDPLLVARSQLLFSAMELGIAQAVLDMSVEYAKFRRQFDKPIGTFQAVKHRCADMAMRVHAARAQTLFAGYHVESRTPDAGFQAAAAKLTSTRAAKLNTADNVQNHGAIGFTVEHDAGLFARRAHMLEFALGGDRVAGPILLEPSRHRFETLPPPVVEWFGAAAAR
jgi:alkylation response protein AidB-like acyl-CoA dehydrogenase